MSIFLRRAWTQIKTDYNSENLSPEVIKLFFMLNSTEQGIYNQGLSIQIQIQSYIWKTLYTPFLVYRGSYFTADFTNLMISPTWRPLKTFYSNYSWRKPPARQIQVKLTTCQVNWWVKLFSYIDYEIYHFLLLFTTPPLIKAARVFLNKRFSLFTSDRVVVCIWHMSRMQKVTCSLYKESHKNPGKMDSCLAPTVNLYRQVHSN